MKPDDLAAIEQHLKLALPVAYRKRLLAGMESDKDLSPFFEQDPQILLISNLELRMYPRRDAFAGASWPANYILIGHDGVGNNYSIEAENPQCTVRIFDHEADRFEVLARGLEEFLAYVTALLALTANEARLSPWSAPASSQQTQFLEIAIVRARRPRESVLNPISIEEWTAFVEADNDMQMIGFTTFVNPFTQEETRCECPGLARMVGENTADQFRYLYGRIVVRDPTRAALAKAEQAARALNAWVLQNG